MMVKRWNPRLRAYYWVEYDEIELENEKRHTNIFEGHVYHGAHSSMEKIYDSVRDYYNSRDWN